MPATMLAGIEQQHRDLAEALDQLLRELRAGSRGFRIYRQFKMYNDLNLNQELRIAERGGSS